MLRTLVIEDEDLIRKMIVSMVKKLDTVTFIGEAASVAEGLILANATQPDLILLDIQLKDGTGFNLLEKLTTIPKVIFITAYNNFGIQAIRVGALDYILKPIDEEELASAIRKITKEKQLSERFLQTVASGKGTIDKLFLKTQEGLHILNLSDILFCLGEGSYTEFHTKDGNKITISKPLKEYETLLPENRFARCHQSYMVNLHEISRIEKTDFIIMNDGTKIPLSTRKRKWFIDSFFSK
jgi:two-component system LytT family response regulator